MSHKYFCDRCNAEIPNWPVQIFVGDRRDTRVELCHPCHELLERWLRG